MSIGKGKKTQKHCEVHFDFVVVLFCCRLLEYFSISVAVRNARSAGVVGDGGRARRKVSECLARTDRLIYGSMVNWVSFLIRVSSVRCVSRSLRPDDRSRVESVGFVEWYQIDDDDRFPRLRHLDSRWSINTTTVLVCDRIPFVRTKKKKKSWKAKSSKSPLLWYEELLRVLIGELDSRLAPCWGLTSDLLASFGRNNNDDDARDRLDMDKFSRQKNIRPTRVLREKKKNAFLRLQWWISLTTITNKDIRLDAVLQR